LIAALAVWSLATIAAYFAARWLYDRVRFPLLHPVIVGIVVLATAIESLGRTYAEYREATAWIVWLAGPAVVAMAVPVYRLRTLLRARLPIVLTVIASGLVFGFTTMTWAFGLLGQPREVRLAGPLHAITSPVALPIARQIGARQDAMVIGVLTAGLIGATVGPVLLRRIGVSDRRARGLALGCGSHAIGVARALEVDAVCGAFATLGMLGNAILGAIIFPYLAHWWIG
jgi:putative effector of murein hydrolase